MNKGGNNLCPPRPHSRGIELPGEEAPERTAQGLGVVFPLYLSLTQLIFHTGACEVTFLKPNAEHLSFDENLLTASQSF